MSSIMELELKLEKCIHKYRNIQSIITLTVFCNSDDQILNSNNQQVVLSIDSVNSGSKKNDKLRDHLLDGVGNQCFDPVCSEEQEQADDFIVIDDVDNSSTAESNTGELVKAELFFNGL